MNAALQSRLAALRRRMLALGAGSGLGAGMLVAAVAMVVAAWLDLLLELPPALRIGSLVVAATAGVALLVAAAGRAASGSNPISLARRMDAAGASRGQILSGVDLMLAGAAGAGTVTGGLASMAIARAAELARKVSPRRAVPANRVGWPYAAFAAVCCGGGLLALLMPRLAMTEWKRFVDPFGDHPPYSRLLISVQPGDIRVVYGAPLDIRAQVEGGVAESMELVLGSRNGAAEALPMFPERGGWRATISSVTTPGDYYLRTRGARSQRHRIDVITVPRIQAVRFRITPPAYTNRPAYEGPLPQGGIAGLSGARVQMWVTSNRPLAGGSLQFLAGGASPTAAPAMTLGATSLNGTEVEGDFSIVRAGRISLRVRDIDGQESAETFTAPVSLLNDARPFVRILEPRPQSLATPEVVLRVEILGEDDYGISRMQLFRGLNDTRVREMELPVRKPPPTRAPGLVPLPLASYGLSPGDVVKIFARVEDNDPMAAKGSESAVTVIRIISQEEMERLQVVQQGAEVLLAKYEQAMRRMEAIGDRLEKLETELKKLDPEAEVPDAIRKQLDELSKALDEGTIELGKAMSSKLPLDLDKAMGEHLREVVELFKSQGAKASELQKNPGKAGGAGAAVGEMARAFGRGRDEFKKDVADPLEHFAKVFPLREAEAEFVELYERQRDIAFRMDALRGVDANDEPAAKVRMRDLEEEQREIRDSLRALLDKIEAAAAQLPDDKRLERMRKDARDFARAVSQSAASARMGDAETALAEFRGSPAYEAAKEAAAILDSFIARCRAVGEEAEAGLRFQPALAEGLGDTVEQLLDSLGLGQNRGERGAGVGQGGYAMRRNTLRNVGLYGSIPPRALPSGAGDGRTQSAVSPHRGSRTGDGGQGDESPSKQLGAAQGEITVPPQYRRSVSDYFQRVADELNQ